jgi:hypothetical protein
MQNALFTGSKSQKNTLSSTGIRELQVSSSLIVSGKSGTMMQPDHGAILRGSGPAVRQDPEKDFQGRSFLLFLTRLPVLIKIKSGNASVPCNILLPN